MLGFNGKGNTMTAAQVVSKISSVERQSDVKLHSVTSRNSKFRAKLLSVSAIFTHGAFAAIAFLPLPAQAQSASPGATLRVCGNTGNWGSLDSGNTQRMRDKLSNSAYFGPGGAYSDSPLTFVVVGTVPTAANLASNNCNIWFSGYDNDPAYTDLQTFANNGGVVIGGCDNSGFAAACLGMGVAVTNYSNVGGGYTSPGVFNPLTCDNGASNPSLVLATAGGASSYFTSGIALARYSDANAFPLVITDSITSPRYILTGDIDMFTNFNATVSAGNTITTDQDQFIANVFKLAADKVTGVTAGLNCGDPVLPSLSMTKVADDDTDRVVGDVITYTYTVTNNGGVIIRNVTVSDTHNAPGGAAPTPGSEAILSDVAPFGDSSDAAQNGSWDILGPGDSVTFTGTYTVTQTDVDNLS